MKQVLIKKGEAVVEDVPAPLPSKGNILVSVFYSCISVGTEIAGIRTTSLPLWKRALKQPENVKKVFESVSNIGIKKTKQLVQGHLNAGNVTGYSAAGIIIGLGDDIKDLKVGDFVACAGAQHAHHAEIINVPRNLVVKIPDGLDHKDASSVTLGSIALQGIRRLKPTIGETFVVVGLGILGQLTVQMLKSNGCNVIGMDLDKSRCDIAIESGMDIAISQEDEVKEDQIKRLTDGFGADGVIITAATESNQLISSSFQMTRKKGRVVVVGDVGLGVKRQDIYAKELDLFISCSYGPGRYDSNYEEKGLDYPISYVRWTENRNMQAYLNLIKNKSINLSFLSPKIYKINNAKEAYQDLNKKGNRPLLSFLKYNKAKKTNGNTLVLGSNDSKNKNKSRIRLALVGAGGFAKGMHLPNIQSLSKDFELNAIVSRSGHNAMATARRYGAKIASTDFNEVIKSNDIDAVLISTRHSLHCEMAIDALKNGKHVLLEKPMALTQKELDIYKKFFEKNKNKSPVFMVGFNRRFSKYAKEIYKGVYNRSNPVIINYTMNAGYIPLDHWVHGSDGGGRNIGEACHIYDLFNYLIGSEVESISANSISPKSKHFSKNDNFVATITYKDGSIANLTYTALGNKKFSKERMEVYCDGKVFFLEDYKTIQYFGYRGKKISSPFPEKGQKQELIEWAQSIKNNSSWPIPLWQQIQATKISFEVDKLIK